MIKTNKMTHAEESRIFNGAWWSVELPEGWSGHPDDECATFHGTPSLGVLQVSSARKDATYVTDQDLKEFASERLRSDVKSERVGYGAFRGFSVQYSRRGLFWREWWLRSGHLMVYATYNVVQGSENKEKEAVETILASLAER